MAKTIDDLIAYQQSRSQEEKQSIEEEKKKLEELRLAIEANGGVAQDNKNFAKQSLIVQQRELDLRKTQ